METTDKKTCRELITILAAHGVSDIVLSPGSRNTPLIIAAHRDSSVRTHVVIDERCAGFFALGLALQSKRPTALICTSGSAVLNYAPAMAEAYYRHVPLIAISADRPAEWIDQDDSQTIRQSNVLGNIVKGSFDINGENSTPVVRRHAVRSINDAALLATQLPQGPVHINIRIDEPLGNTETVTATKPAKIELTGNHRYGFTDGEATALLKELDNKNILVVAGFGSRDSALDAAIDRFAASHAAAVLHEVQSNLHPACGIGNIDACLSAMSAADADTMRPDVVITMGGAIVSRMVKHYLRNTAGLVHWHITHSPHSIDCFGALTRRIEHNEADVFDSLSPDGKQPSQRQLTFRHQWLETSKKAQCLTADYLNGCEWSDFKAMGRLVSKIPASWNIHLSNGTCVRYAQLFDCKNIHDIQCNRGVSGIDGSSSTAVGAHTAYDGITLLVSGDMSAQYDAGAFALNQITPRFKLAVLNNSGGGIFRFIKSTSGLDECEECFAAKVNLPLKGIAAAYGFAYFEADNEQSFEDMFDAFAAETTRPSILNIITPAQKSADILKKFFTTKQ